MKKKYIRPESRLFTINLSENIAGSGVTDGEDIVSGNTVIKFTHTGDGCRGYYSGITTAPVTVSGTFYDYYAELDKIVSETQNYFLYFNCLKSIYL